MSCVSLPACFICCNSCFGSALLHLLRSSSLKISGVASPMGGLTRSRGVSRGRGVPRPQLPLLCMMSQLRLWPGAKMRQTHMMCVSAEPTCQCNMQLRWRRRWRHRSQSLLTTQAAADLWLAAQLARLQPKALWLHLHCPLLVQPLGNKQTDH